MPFVTEGENWTDHHLRFFSTPLHCLHCREFMCFYIYVELMYLFCEENSECIAYIFYSAKFEFGSIRMESLFGEP